MAASSEEENETNVYHDLISDHKDVITREIDIDQAIKDFEYKDDVINKADFTNLFNERNKVAKCERFINSLLKRKKRHELKVFFKIITEGDSQHYLRTVLKTRMARSTTMSYKNKTPANSSQASVGGSSIQNELPSVEDPQTSGLSYLQREKRHLEEDLDKAQRTIQDKTDQIDCLKEDKDELKVQLQEAKTKIETMQKELHSLDSVNSDLKVQLQGAKENIESLQNKLIVNNAEMSNMKVEIRELKDQLQTVSEELQELKPLKRFLQEPKKSKSKTCTTM